MGNGIYQMNVCGSRSDVWTFIRNMDAWAPLVPGYKEHVMHSDRQSTWEFHVHYGMVKKKIHVKVLITDWNEPSEVRFTLNGINQRFTGAGFFKAEELDGALTRMTGSLSIESTSPLAKLLQTTFDNMIAELTKELTMAVGKAIERGGA
ncbi:carbon monoxide dehydrogenase [Bacillus sp. AFS015802]|uniref:CoxG family protein n=1 Tax=Bacillus sp. AFS015802 TaxID=2033486 RepID=UPI000BF651FB|nr:SRPBCC family protein [Bacillus sp. AFS015802]PFA62160.1 carbon monoxide dehydrogenase [Bacillus sp. AFS015802]